MLISENLTTADKVLKTSNIDFISFGLDEEEVDQLKTFVASIVPCATYITGSFLLLKLLLSIELLKLLCKLICFRKVFESESILTTKWRHLTFGCSALDQITRNGVPIRGITEIVGESGCKKFHTFTLTFSSQSKKN